jgi:hypothetical protein
MLDRRRLFVLSGISLGGAAALNSQGAVAFAPAPVANSDAQRTEVQSIPGIQKLNQFDTEHVDGTIVQIPSSEAALTESAMASASFVTPAAQAETAPMQNLGGTPIAAVARYRDISPEDSSFKGESFFVADQMKNVQFDGVELLASPELQNLGSQVTPANAPDRSTRSDISRTNPNQAMNEYWSGVAPTPANNSKAGAPILK